MQYKFINQQPRRKRRGIKPSARIKKGMEYERKNKIAYRKFARNSEEK